MCELPGREKHLDMMEAGCRVIQSLREDDIIMAFVSVACWIGMFYAALLALTMVMSRCRGGVSARHPLLGRRSLVYVYFQCMDLELSLRARRARRAHIIQYVGDQGATVCAGGPMAGYNARRS